MPMVPGLTATVSSEIVSSEMISDYPFQGLFEDFPLESLFPFETIPADDTVHVLGIMGSDPYNILESYTDGMYDSTSHPLNEFRRGCMFGKPEDQCLRECGTTCDPFKQEPRVCGCSQNMPFPHNCCVYKMVDPQSVLPIQIPYSPYNDHSYVSIGYPDSETKLTNSYESDSLTDDSGDEIVDVETVQEKMEPPVKIAKKRGRKPAQKLKPSRSKTASMNRRTIKKKPKRTVLQTVLQTRPAGRYKCSMPSRELSSSASSSEAEDNGKRNNHNDMERQRRDVQKTMLQSVRVNVPSIKNNPKAPKVMILTEAAKYCTHLTKIEKRNSLIVASYTEKAKKLEERLEQLQRELGIELQ